MAKISVDGINAQAAPSPIQLRTWTDAWTEAGLAGLTKWAAHNDNTAYTCTTTADEAAANAVVANDLENWVNADRGHRNFHVTDD